MIVWMIWAQDPSDPSVVWLVSAWDDESKNENNDVWLETLANAEQEHGSRFLRVTTTYVNYEKVVEAFNPVVI